MASRNEDILISIIEGTEYNKPTESRMEELLLELKEILEAGGGGGGGGGSTVTKSGTNGNIRVNGREVVVYDDTDTTDTLEKAQTDIIGLKSDIQEIADDISELQYDIGNIVVITSYNDLGNKPQINSYELSGDKSAADLGLASASDMRTAQNKISTLENSVATNTSDISALQYDLSQISVITDYGNLSGKPQINGTELTSNKSAADLGLATVSEMQAAQGRISTLESDVAENTSDISALQYEVSQISVITDYSGLSGKPSINGCELSGEVSLEDIGIESVTVDSVANADSDNAVSNKAVVSYVNNAISANAADFLGTFETGEELPESAQNNDYAFVSVTDSEGNTVHHFPSF